MNTPKLLSFLTVATIFAAGCEKPADLGRMQEETITLVTMHAKDVDALQRRSDALLTRGRNLGGDAPGIADAGRLLSEARAGLDQLKAQIGAAPGTLGNAVKAGDVDEVQRTSDELLEKLAAGEVTVRTNLAAVDNWLMSVENRPMRAIPPPAPPAPPPVTNETPVPPPTTDSPPGTGTGTGSGSAAHN